jgi:hypothetical protein
VAKERTKKAKGSHTAYYSSEKGKSTKKRCRLKARYVRAHPEPPMVDPVSLVKCLPYLHVAATWHPFYYDGETPPFPEASLQYFKEKILTVRSWNTSASMKRTLSLLLHADKIDEPEHSLCAQFFLSRTQAFIDTYCDAQANNLYFLSGSTEAGGDCPHENLFFHSADSGEAGEFSTLMVNASSSDGDDDNSDDDDSDVELA